MNPIMGRCGGVLSRATMVVTLFRALRALLIGAHVLQVRFRDSKIDGS